MSKFNNKLKARLSTKQEMGFTTPKQVQKPNTTNREGHAANSINGWLRLISMLNTLKLEDQFYRTENATLSELRNLINQLAKEDAYGVAQCIVYSRCIGEGMRSINHAATVFIAPHISGMEWSKRFYSTWNRRTQHGGVIFRPDDMAEIMACYKFFNSKALPNAMKKGFASAIENFDLYQFGKYTKQIRDVANMVHPNPEKTFLIYEDFKGEKWQQDFPWILDWIMQGNNIPAHTWENAQSETGQLVAKAVKAGEITQEQANQLQQEQNAANWEQLLSEGKLGILACLRNLRNMLNANIKPDTLNMVINLLTDPKKILQGKIMPYQFDLAQEVIAAEFNSIQSRKIVEALNTAYTIALPNLSELLQGNNLVIVDMSGSMWMGNGILKDPNRKTAYKTYAGDKAATIAATIAKATNADIIRFGANAEYVNYNPNQDVFTLGRSFVKNMGSTNLAAAWQLAAQSGRKYDRVFILSDYECNRGNSYAAYQNYVNTCGNPYVYQIDLAAYGTTQLVGPKVRYYYGFGYSMFNDIATSEFNPSYHLDKIKQIKI